MSTSQFQSALVKLIRYPELNRGQNVEQFISQFNLTEKEQWQLRSLATSYYVTKFGRDQRGTRFDLNGLGTLPLTVRVVGRKTMGKEIYGIRFEPLSEGTPTREIGKRFAQYFIDNASTLVAELKLPEFVGDLARYEFAEYFMRGPEVNGQWSIASASCLRADVPIRIERFSFDMVAFAEAAKQMEDAELSNLIPEKRPTIVLFARVPDETGGFDLKQFEIDETLASFISGHIGPCEAKALGSDLPPFYGELVSLSLCHPLSL